MESFWALGVVREGRESFVRDQFLDCLEDLPKPYLPLRNSSRWLKRARKFLVEPAPAFPKYLFFDFGSDIDRKLPNVNELPGKPVELVRSERSVEFYGERFIMRTVSRIPEREIDKLRRFEASGFMDKLPDELELQVKAGEVLIVARGALAGARAFVKKSVVLANVKSIPVSLGSLSVRVPVSDFVSSSGALLFD